MPRKSQPPQEEITGDDSGNSQEMAPRRRTPTPSPDRAVQTKSI